jgi:DNA polymerase
MQTLVIDFETYYDSAFSLKKMPNLLYVRDKRFLVHGAAVKLNDQPAEWVPRAALPEYFAAVPWDRTTAISHNSNFDMVVLYEKYGISPARRVDTLALCRMLLSHDLDFDLGSIAPLLGLGEKGDDLDKTKGVRELTPELEALLAAYAIQDAELEYGIYKTLMPELPAESADWMDVVIRMSTEGTLLFDTAMAKVALKEAIAERDSRIAATGFTAQQLRSRNAFPEILRKAGVEPPTKISDRTGEVTWAFSKNDPDFVALRSEPEVAVLIEGRLAASSSNAIKRIENLTAIATAEPHTLPVQLNVSGAHTHRLSGSGGINMQNLNRGSALRLAIHVPDDCVLLVADSSQIELRGNMWFSSQRDVLDLLGTGEYVYTDDHVEWKGGDVYRLEASRQFGCAAEDVTKQQRQFGKVVQLGCGYGMGAKKFRAQCAIGPMGNPPIYITDDDSVRTITTYRTNHPFIKASWDWLTEVAVPAMACKDTHIERGPIVIEHESILLPDGMRLLYPNLEATEDGYTWGIDGVTHRIYGGILQENIIQALAGVAIKQQALTVVRELKHVRLLHQVHDELIMLCPKSEARSTLREVAEIMSRPLPWAPDLPLRCEAAFAQNYSK